MARDLVAAVAALGIVAVRVIVSDGSEVSNGAERFALLRGVRGM